MEITIFGSVASGPMVPVPTCRRFVAVMDILGMSEWVLQKPLAEVAGLIKSSLVAGLGQAPQALVRNVPTGPLVKSAFFSDTVLLYTRDNSWESLYCVLTVTKSILHGALFEGLPIRGAISVGEMAVDRPSSLYAGDPIRDAFVSSEKDETKPYRSVGVHLTDSCLADLRARLGSLPQALQGELSPDVVAGAADYCQTLLRFRGMTFVNFWGAHFAGSDHGMPMPVSNEDGEVQWQCGGGRVDRLRANFWKRGIGKGDARNEKKVDEMVEKFRHSASLNQAHRRTYDTMAAVDALTPHLDRPFADGED